MTFSPNVPLTPALQTYWQLLVPHVLDGDILTVGEVAHLFGTKKSPARRTLVALREAGLPIPAQVGDGGLYGRCPRCHAELAEAVVPIRGPMGRMVTTRWCPECSWDEGAGND